MEEGSSPTTDVGDQDKVPGFWVQLGSSPGRCRYPVREPADGGYLALCLSNAISAYIEKPSIFQNCIKCV